MKTFLHTENLNSLKQFKDKEWECILTEPNFSYRHPHIQTESEFIDLFNQSITLGYLPYIQVNGYIEESQLDDLKSWLNHCISLKPKGFYFNDFAVYNHLKEINYSGEIVYSPETILTNAMDIEVLLERVDRVVLSKELTLEEITTLMNLFPNKIEAFGLGYGLMSFSKRPLVRNYLDEIKHNRVVLNQTNLTIKESKRDQFFPILEESQGTSIFLDTVLFPKHEQLLMKDASCFGLHYDDCMLGESDFNTLIHLLTDETVTLEDAQLQSKVKLGQAYYYRKTNMSKEEGK
ncbi:MAG: peptidase U32 family protein [Erysipelotrichaceae bacterium]